MNEGKNLIENKIEAVGTEPQFPVKKEKKAKRGILTVLLHTVSLISFNFSTLLQFELVYRGATIGVISYLLHLLFVGIMKMSGNSFLTPTNIKSLLLNPVCMILLLVYGCILAFVSLFNICGCIIIYDASNRKEKINVMDAALGAFVESKRLLTKSNIAMVPLLVIVLPFAGSFVSGGIISKLTMPEFIQEYIDANNVLSIVNAVIYLAASIWVSKVWYMFHYFILQRDTVAGSIKKSRIIFRKRFLREYLTVAVITGGLITGVCILLDGTNVLLMRLGVLGAPGGPVVYLILLISAVQVTGVMILEMPLEVAAISASFYSLIKVRSDRVSWNDAYAVSYVRSGGAATGRVADDPAGIDRDMTDDDKGAQPEKSGVAAPGSEADDPDGSSSAEPGDDGAAGPEKPCNSNRETGDDGAAESESSSDAGAAHKLVTPERLAKLRNVFEVIRRLTVPVIIAVALLFPLIVLTVKIDFSKIPGFVYSAEVTAHRGASAVCPENTMSAFREAARLKSDWVELDVQLSSDGQVFVMHDTDFTRTAGVKKNAWELSYDEIYELDAGSWFSESFKGEHFPLLSEVLEFSKETGMKLNIEIKRNGHDEGIEEKVVRLIKDYGLQGQCLVASLDYPVLEKVKECDPDIGTLYNMTVAYGDLEKLKAADHYSIEATFAKKRLIKKANAAGHMVFVWTVDTEENMEKVLDNGADNIITNDIITARTVVNDDVLSVLGPFIKWGRGEITAEEMIAQINASGEAGEDDDAGGWGLIR